MAAKRNCFFFWGGGEERMFLTLRGVMIEENIKVICKHQDRVQPSHNDVTDTPLIEEFL